MKADESRPNISRKRKRPESLPALSNTSEQGEVSIWKEHVRVLAEARLKIQPLSGTAHLDAINVLHRRAAALSEIMAEAAYSSSGSEMPSESLAEVMGIIEEDVKVAGCIAAGMHDLLNNLRRF